MTKVSLPFGLEEIVLPIKEAVVSSGKFAKPVTVFMPEIEQKVDALAVSRGYGEDGIERALLRGKVGKMAKKSMELVVGPKSYKIYFPRVFEQLCIPSTITDKKGVMVETKKGFIDLTTYRDGVEERGMEDISEISAVGDEAPTLWPMRQHPCLLFNL
ncbi:MAG: hypothetical protein HZB50_11455 [Chloroflexi bacterium]|nr:hypothetical protein [Chloroflexota bacterium]